MATTLPPVRGPTANSLADVHAVNVQCARARMLPRRRLNCIPGTFSHNSIVIFEICN